MGRGLGGGTVISAAGSTLFADENDFWTNVVAFISSIKDPLFACSPANE